MKKKDKKIEYLRSKFIRLLRNFTNKRKKSFFFK